MRRLFLLALLALPLTARADGDFMMWPTLQGAKKSKPAPGSLFTDDANTLSHVYWTPLTDKKSLPWTMNGTVPQVAASGRTPPGAGQFSTSNNYELATTPTAIDVSGDFTVLIAFKPATVGSTEVMLTSRSSGLNGYDVRLVGATGQIQIAWSSDGVNSTNGSSTSTVNVACVGHTGVSWVAQLNSTAATVSTNASVISASGLPEYLGKRADGFAFPGVIYEMMFTTTGATAASCAAAISAAQAKLGVSL